MKGYLEMVKGAKNQRLQEMLGQTDACLRSFAAKLGLTQLLSGGREEAGGSSSNAKGAGRHRLEKVKGRISGMGTLGCMETDA